MVCKGVDGSIDRVMSTEVFVDPETFGDEFADRSR